jgi:hypothetical protein
MEESDISSVPSFVPPCPVINQKSSIQCTYLNRYIAIIWISISIYCDIALNIDLRYLN